ncbi:MAG: type II secretion system GspH family protein [Dehalococcoidia bacterium]|jgi:type IV pilus assembly protein PilA|nr:type II secretion system GspH family protein [Dehalococcoidia bacterium]
MKGLISKVMKGERGFTLIELLVVVAILGIIAAVVVLNIGSFIGSGAEESANTEAHQVQTAVIAYMTAEGLTTFTEAVGPATTTGPEQYLLNQARLQATYTITDGSISAASPTSGGKWDTCTFSLGAWSCP